MAISKAEFLKQLSDCVVEMEDEKVVGVAQEYLAAGYPAFDGVMEGLVDGMNRASVLYEEEEYFVSDILLCSDAMYAGLNVLKPHFPVEESTSAKQKIVIGVVEGDTHDIGKNLVRIMLETAGFEVYDLGRDVPLADFVNKAKEVEAEMICLSTLMTTTMVGMGEVVKMLHDEKMREGVKVMVGGGPISQSYAKKIGADGYAPNAVEAVKLVKELLAVS